MRKRQNAIHALHAPIEIVVGFALLAIPFAIGFQAPGLVASVALGAVLIGLALASTSSSGRGSLSPAAHADLDLGMALGLLAAAAVLGFGGQGIAFLVLIVSGIVQLTLTALTRYSAATA
jgi:hypothetical protein